jgi:outer membrane protein OmpA-like peptidoglycan-associated protein
VVGFADRITEPGNASAVSRRRAEVTRDQLLSMGFRPENIQIASAGSAYATALAHERIKQTTERRVEIWLLQ